MYIYIYIYIYMHLHRPHLGLEAAHLRLGRTFIHIYIYIICMYIHIYIYIYIHSCRSSSDSFLGDQAVTWIPMPMPNVVRRTISYSKLMQPGSLYRLFRAGVWGVNVTAQGWPFLTIKVFSPFSTITECMYGFSYHFKQPTLHKITKQTSIIHKHITLFQLKLWTVGVEIIVGPAYDKCYLIMSGRDNLTTYSSQTDIHRVIYIYIYIIYTYMYTIRLSLYIYLSLSLSLSLHIYIYIYIYIYINNAAGPRQMGGPSGRILSTQISNSMKPYGQFSQFHVCFCGLDPGNLKFETARTNKQHICF